MRNRRLGLMKANKRAPGRSEPVAQWLANLGCIGGRLPAAPSLREPNPVKHAGRYRRLTGGGGTASRRFSWAPAREPVNQLDRLGSEQWTPPGLRLSHLSKNNLMQISEMPSADTERVSGLRSGRRATRRAHISLNLASPRTTERRSIKGNALSARRPISWVAGAAF